MDYPFSLLAEPVRRALRSMGIVRPTPIQEMAVEPILEGRSVLLMAPAGWGKTEAAVAPILSMMLEEGWEGGGVRVLYITPLRALNRDLEGRIGRLAFSVGYRCGVRHGDTPPSEREAQARHPPDILITTPESLEAILPGKVMRRHLSKVKYVVVDEVHDFIESKRGVELSLLIERLRHIAGDFQRIGLSATVRSVDLAIEFLGGNVELISVDVPKLVRFSVEYPVPSSRDRETAEALGVSPWVAARLRRIAEATGKARLSLLFANSRSAVEFLSAKLKNMLGEKVWAVHHGSIARELRLKTEEEAREGILKGVVCTSSLELGIDLGRVDLVVQYGSPRTVVNLLQRTGRSGHSMTRTSYGIILAESPLDVAESMVIADMALKGKLEPPAVEYKPYDVLALQILGILLERGEAAVDEVYNMVRSSVFYRSLSRDELTRVIAILRRNRLIKVSGNKIFRLRKAWRQYYSYLSMIPEVDEVKLVNIADGSVIGTLDANFSAEYVEVGARFIFKGEPWEVVSYDSEAVYVKPAAHVKARIPWWEGEYIPVPYPVALKVSALLNTVSEWMQKGIGISEIVEMLSSTYPAARESCKAVAMLVRDQLRSTGLTPSPDTILIEYSDGTIIVHAFFGHRVNSALARASAYHVSLKTGEAVKTCYSAYGFALLPEVPVDFRLEDVKAEKVIEYFRASSETSKRFSRKLLQVAYRFGSIVKPVEPSMVDPLQLVVKFKEGIEYQEAFKEEESFTSNPDKAAEILDMIQKREIKVHHVKTRRPSPLAEYILSKPFFRVKAVYKVSHEALKGLEGVILGKLARKPMTSTELASLIGLESRKVRSILLDLKSRGLVYDILFTDRLERVWFVSPTPRGAEVHVDYETVRKAVKRIFDVEIASAESLLKLLVRAGPLRASWLKKMGIADVDTVRTIVKSLTSRRKISLFLVRPGQEPFIVTQEQHRIFASSYREKIDTRDEMILKALKIQGDFKEICRRLRIKPRFARDALVRLQKAGLTVYDGERWYLYEEYWGQPFEMVENSIIELVRLLLMSGPKRPSWLIKVTGLSPGDIYSALASIPDARRIIVKSRSGYRKMYCLQSFILQL